LDEFIDHNIVIKKARPFLPWKMLLECDSGNTGHASQYVGWIQVQGPGNAAAAMYSYSVQASSDQPHLVDCSSISLDPELLRILKPIREEAFFIEKLRGLKEPQALSRDLQSFVDELCSDDYSSHKATFSSNRDTSTGGAHNNSNTTPYDVQTYLHASECGFSSIQLAHIAEIGWHHVESANADMSKLTLSVIDSHQRKHVFEVRFDVRMGGYPWAPPDISAELPVAVLLPHWPSRSANGGNLKLVLDAVTAEAEKYADLLDILEDLDRHCCVLEPMRPSFAVTTRRIALERSCSLYLDFPDPLRNPHAMCSIRFLGPPDKLASYQNSLQTNAHKWRSPNSNESGGGGGGGHVRAITPTPLNQADSFHSYGSTSSTSKVSKFSSSGSGHGALVRENIQDILSLVLPAPRRAVSGDHLPHKRARVDSARAPSTAASTSASGAGMDIAVTEQVEVEYVTECGICYSFNGAEYGSDTQHDNTTDSEAQMPDQVCPNSQCGKMFHKNCLVEWLRAVPSSRSSFGTIFGSCPYCCERLSVNSLL